MTSQNLTRSRHGHGQQLLKNTMSKDKEKEVVRKRKVARKKRKNDATTSTIKPMPRLPPEIWMIIFEHLPASFFQRDIRRLMVSKSWYSLALPAFYPRIEFTPRVISRLVHRKTASLSRTRSLLRKTLRSVNIVLDPGLGLYPPGVRGGRVVGGDPKTACFNTPSNLTRFGRMLLDFGALTHVRFTAYWPNREWRADPLQANYLSTSSLRPYLHLALTTQHVASLDLDLCGTNITDDDGRAVHFCWHVRPLLSRLRSLRLRLRRICHEALWPLDDQPVTLGEISLNLYLGRVSDHNPKLNASWSCDSSSSGLGRTWARANPMDEMRGTMKPLVREMAEPRRAEIVHLAPNGEIHIWDAATDACVRDVSEKPRRFPACFDVDPGRPCFSEDVDDWDGGAGAVSPGDLSDGEGSEELDDLEEPEEPEVMDGVVELDGVEDAGAEDIHML